MTGPRLAMAKRVWKESGSRRPWGDRPYLRVLDRPPLSLTAPGTNETTSPSVSVVEYRREGIYYRGSQIGWIVTTTDGYYIGVVGR